LKTTPHRLVRLRIQKPFDAYRTHGCCVAFKNRGTTLANRAFTDETEMSSQTQPTGYARNHLGSAAVIAARSFSVGDRVVNPAAAAGANAQRRRQARQSRRDMGSYPFAASEPITA